MTPMIAEIQKRHERTEAAIGKLGNVPTTHRDRGTLLSYVTALEQEVQRMKPVFDAAITLGMEEELGAGGALEQNNDR